MKKIIIAGDLYLDSIDEKKIKEGKIESVFGNVLPYLLQADIVIPNVEATICEKSKKVKKCGPHFSISPQCLSGLLKANMKYFCIANNHIKDFGEEGIKETLKSCNKNGIKVVGAGINIDEALEPLKVELDEVKVGIIAASENENQIASRKIAGTAPIDCYELYRSLKKLENDCDLKIVLLHGGKECFRYPTPRMKKLSHMLVDWGADCVIWHHSHCSSGIEKYREKFISYGIGNFLLNYDIQYSHFFKSYFVEISIKDKGKVEYKIVPYFQHISESMSLMNTVESKKFISDIEEISKILVDEQKYQEKWERFCERVSDTYLSELLGYGRIFNRIGISKGDLNKSLYKRYMFDEEEVLKLRSMLSCETHQEIFQEIMQRMLYRDKECNSE